LVVAVGLTAALWGVAAELVGALTAGRPATPDAALVRLCVAALLLAVGWAWLQGLAGVADAWRGCRPCAGEPTGVRRLVRVACGAACGVALAGALGAPAGADSAGPRPDLRHEARHGSQDYSRLDALAGLPLPERAEGRAHPPERSVVVDVGASLWGLARQDLGPTAGDGRVTARWHAIYRRNRGVIGNDPDLIRPGQVLHLIRPAKERP
jgi:hypothetical protein